MTLCSLNELYSADRRKERDFNGETKWPFQLCGNKSHDRVTKTDRPQAISSSAWNIPSTASHVMLCVHCTRIVQRMSYKCWSGATHPLINFNTIYWFPGFSHERYRCQTLCISSTRFAYYSSNICLWNNKLESDKKNRKIDFRTVLSGIKQSRNHWRACIPDFMH